MASVSRMTQFAERPLQGAVLGLIIVGCLWFLGLLEAFSAARPMALPVAILAGAVVGRWFLRPLCWSAALLSVVVAIGLWTPITDRFGPPFVRNDALNVNALDAVYVMSNSVNSSGLVAFEGIDRILTGIAVRAHRPALPLVLSVVRFDGARIGVSSQADQRALVALSPASGPTEWIDSVYSTRDEAIGLAQRALQRRWKHLAVVTSPTHTRRACAAVEETGLRVTCVVAPPRAWSWPPRSTSDRRVLMQHLTYETLAWAQYRLTGWAKW
jgi:hypothetical protein